MLMTIASEGARGARSAGIWLGRAGAGISAAFMIVITVLSVFSTVAFNGVSDEHVTIYTWLGPLNYMPLNGMFVFLLLVLAISLAWKRGGLRVSERTLVGAMVLFTSLVGFAWVGIQGSVTTVFPDSQRLMDYATQAVQGDWSGFQISVGGTKELLATDNALRYFTQYPFQAGVFWYFYLVFSVVRDVSQHMFALQVINVFANEVAILAIWCIGKAVLPTDRARRLLLLLLALCFPLVFSASFAYGNSLGLAFACCFLFCQVRALACTSNSAGIGRSVRLVLLSFAPLSLALVVKSTFVLFAIAVLIAWVVRTLQHHCSWPSLAMLVVVVLAANTVSSIPTGLLEQVSGASFGRGMPKTSWILIGLSRSSLLDQAGWWDLTAWNLMLSTSNDYALQQSQGMALIAQHISLFFQDPAGALGFFAEKLSTEWSEPTFGSLYYASTGMNAAGKAFDSYGALGYVAPAPALIALFDGYQLIVYAGVLAALIGMARGRSLVSAGLLLAAVFFTGFGCYLLWEAKSMYLLPFFVLLLPLAASGLADFFDGGCQGKGNAR